MLTELTTKSQVTIPRNIIIDLGLEEGDVLDIYENNGMICIMPVAVHSKDYIDMLHNEIDQLKVGISSGTQPVFDNIDDMFNSLEKF